MKIKIVILPIGYQDINVDNDNVDLNIIFEDGRVYFVNIFTLTNVKELMEKEYFQYYFWSTDMFIVKDLQIKTIRNAVMKIIEDGYEDNVFCQIGTLENKYTEFKSFDDINWNLLPEE